MVIAAATTWVLVNKRGARIGAVADHPHRTVLGSRKLERLATAQTPP